MNMAIPCSCIRHLDMSQAISLSTWPVQPQKMPFDSKGYQGMPKTPPGRRCLSGSAIECDTDDRPDAQRPLFERPNAEHCLSWYWPVTEAHSCRGQYIGASKAEPSSKHRQVSWMLDKTEPYRRHHLRSTLENFIRAT